MQDDRKTLAFILNDLQARSVRNQLDQALQLGASSFVIVNTKPDSLAETALREFIATGGRDHGPPLPSPDVVAHGTIWVIGTTGSVDDLLEGLQDG